MRNRGGHGNQQQAYYSSQQQQRPSRGGIVMSAPSGPAGGVLGGTYPDPDFAVDMATQAELDTVNTAKAPLASPALTGNPTAPTQTVGNNSTRLATTAFVAEAAPLGDLKRRLWMPSGAIDETFPRFLGINTTSVVSGTLKLCGGAVIRTGLPVTSISFFTSVGVVTPTAQWACLVRESDNAVLAKTADRTNTAWAINTVQTYTFASAYVPLADAAVYLGLVVVAATAPTLAAMSIAAIAAATAPGPYGCAADAGLTDPASLGATATPGANSALGYGYYS